MRDEFIPITVGNKEKSVKDKSYQGSSIMESSEQFLENSSDSSVVPTGYVHIFITEVGHSEIHATKEQEEAEVYHYKTSSDDIHIKN